MRTSHTPSKYKAKRTEVDGIVFASKKEANRYAELKLLERAGEIHSLRLQPVFPLIAVGEDNGRRHMVGTYRADFSYCVKDSAALVVEDVKGFKTPMYRWKKRHMAAQYGIAIEEI